MFMYALKYYLRHIKDSKRNHNRSIFEIRHEHDTMLAKLPHARGVSWEDAKTPVGPWRIFTPASLSYDTHIIHFHGGTLCMGSITSHSPFVSYLAHYTQSKILLPEYRLAPEHPYPASFEDALAFYRYVTEDMGIPAEKIIISADSGGALLAFSLVHRCHALLLSPPSMLLLFAPAANAEILDQEDLYADLDTRDPLLDVAQIRRFSQGIFGNHPTDDPLVSPLYADYTAFPPFFSVIGSEELLLDSLRFVHIKAVKAHVDCQLMVQKNCFHGHFMFPGFMPEADRAIQAAASFMHQRASHLQIVATPLDVPLQQEVWSEALATD